MGVVRVRKKTQQRARQAAAWMGLLAVALLYSPMAGAAWLALRMNEADCCAGGYCPMKAHHQHKKNSAPKNSTPMDCGHEKDSGGMTACATTCCKKPERTAVMPSTFVLPALNFAAISDRASHEIFTRMRAIFSYAAQPLSPPPRITA